jgi:hypothetical protein
VQLTIKVKVAWRHLIYDDFDVVSNILREGRVQRGLAACYQPRPAARGVIELNFPSLDLSVYIDPGLDHHQYPNRR